MTMNEAISSIDKANLENMMSAIDTKYSIDKNVLLNKINELNNCINTLKTKIAIATAKPEYNVNVNDVFDNIQAYLQKIKLYNEQLEILEKTYDMLKIN